MKVTDDQENPVEWAKDVVYGPAGEMTQLREYDPVRGYETETRSYNARLQVTGIQWGPGFVGQGGGRELHYSYNDTANDGRIRQLQRVDHSIYGTTTTTTTDYLYDELGRLKTAGAASYTYDGFGNRLTQTAPSMNLTYNASNNRITSAGYTYDANGNLTATPELTLAYDVENRLVEAVHATNGTERYAYAPNGQRVWKSGWQGGIYFYGVDGKVLGLYRLTEVYYGEPGTEPVWYDVMQEQWTNVYLGGRMVRGRNYSVVEDRLGTVNGPAMNPYGDGQVFEGYGFTGYYHDGITGFDYAQQRYYAPALGRFTTPDPYQASAAIARPQSWNRYAYVENDPVNNTDPSGLVPGGLQRDLYQGYCRGGQVGDLGGDSCGSPSGGGGCTLDGVEVPCDAAYSILQGGGAVLYDGPAYVKTEQGWAEVKFDATGRMFSVEMIPSPPEQLTDDQKNGLRNRAEEALIANGVPQEKAHAAAWADDAGWKYAGGHWNLLIPGAMASDFPEFRIDTTLFSTHAVWRHDAYAVHVDCGNPTAFPYVPGALVHGAVDVVYGTVATPNLDNACLNP